MDLALRHGYLWHVVPSSSLRSVSSFLSFLVRVESLLQHRWLGVTYRCTKHSRGEYLNLLFEGSFSGQRQIHSVHGDSVAVLWRRSGRLHKACEGPTAQQSRVRLARLLVKQPMSATSSPLPRSPLYSFSIIFDHSRPVDHSCICIVDTGGRVRIIHIINALLYRTGGFIL
jgi:hypothetical protein